jgi:hypothetical protein
MPDSAQIRQFFSHLWYEASFVNRLALAVLCGFVSPRAERGERKVAESVFFHFEASLT